MKTEILQRVNFSGLSILRLACGPEVWIIDGHFICEINKQADERACKQLTSGRCVIFLIAEELNDCVKMSSGHEIMKLLV